MLVTLAGWGYFWYQARESKFANSYELPDLEKGEMDAELSFKRT